MSGNFDVTYEGRNNCENSLLYILYTFWSMRQIFFPGADLIFQRYHPVTFSESGKPSVCPFWNALGIILHLTMDPGWNLLATVPQYRMQLSIELCPKSRFLLKALTKCWRGSLRAHSFSLGAGTVSADAYAGLRTPGFCLREVLVATLLLGSSVPNTSK